MTRCHPALASSTNGPDSGFAVETQSDGHGHFLINGPLELPVSFSSAVFHFRILLVFLAVLTSTTAIPTTSNLHRALQYPS